MITDSQTNFVFISSLLKERHSTFFKDFIYLLDEIGIEWKLLEKTKDIWCRDYMPIQIAKDKFVQFKYNPDYLLDEKYRHLKTSQDFVCKAIDLKPAKSKLIIDGGNIVKSKTKVIVTDKVYDDNDTLSEHEIRRELRESLGVDEIISIPQEPCDITGHADGMVRFINDRAVLMNDYSPFMPTFHRDLLEIFAEHNLNVKLLPYRIFDEVNTDKIPSAVGNYVNFLQMKNIIVFPQYGIKEDEAALSVVKTIFQEYDVKTVDCNSIAREGGVLNCITWNIYKTKIHFI